MDAIPASRDQMQIDTSRMSATFCISRPVEDRSEDLVNPEGLLPWIDEYRMNPVVFYDHAFGDIELPIGRSEDDNGNLAVTISQDGVWGCCYFSQTLKEAAQVFALVDEGILRAASPFIIEKKFSVRPGTGRNKDRPGLFIDEWSMAEWSIVGVPDNQEAVRKALDRGTLAGSPICEALKKSLRSVAARTPVQGRGFDPAAISGGTATNDAFTLASILAPRPTIMSMAKSLHKSAKVGKSGEDKDEEAKRLAKEFEERDDVKKLTKEYSEIKDDDSEKAKSRRKEIEDQYKSLRKAAGMSEGDDDIPDSPGEGRQKDAADGDGDGDEVTPLGSQILKAAHAALSEVADQMEQAIKPVENPQVKDYCDGMVDQMRGHMDEINDLHKSEYGEEVAKEESETADPESPNNDPPEANGMQKFLARAKSHRQSVRGLASQALKLGQSKHMPKQFKDDLARISRRLFAITKAAEKHTSSGEPSGAEWKAKYEALQGQFDELLTAFEKAVPHRR